jgi:hypothetical protein
VLNTQRQYHKIIRKTIVAFGRLFSNIQITRESSEEADNQTINVPISYAPKEKWLVRIEEDPNLSGHVYTTLPRLSFEITGYDYDVSRKTNRMGKINCYGSDDSRGSMFSPVPYNINITLYVLTKTQEDALQIIEQILPTFTPEYSLSINAIPEMNIIQNVPVILNSVDVSDEYDGDFQTRRFVTHTLNFTLKTNLFGNITEQGIINDVSVNINTSQIPPSNELTFNAYVGSVGGTITESWEDDI